MCDEINYDLRKQQLINYDLFIDEFSINNTTYSLTLFNVFTDEKLVIKSSDKETLIRFMQAALPDTTDYMIKEGFKIYL